MDYTIVDAQPRHISQLECLERVCFSVPWTAEQLASQLPDEHHEFLVAEAADGTLLGYVGMMVVLDEGYISNVAVNPSFQRQGIGDALIDALLEKADRRDLSFVTLEVRQNNDPAASLYRKHAFEPVGIRKNYYDLPKEDAILMTYFRKKGSEI